MNSKKSSKTTKNYQHTNHSLFPITPQPKTPTNLLLNNYLHIFSTETDTKNNHIDTNRY